MNNNLLIVGSGEWAKQAEEIAKAMGCYEKIEIFSNEEMDQNELLRNIESKAGEFSYGIAVSESDVERLFYDSQLLEFGFCVAKLIHPESVIMENVSLQNGCVIDKAVVIQNGSSLGIGTLVFEGVVVGMNSAVGDVCGLKQNSIVAPNSLLRMGRVLSENQVFQGVDDITRFVMGEQNQNQCPSFDRGEEWVKQYMKDFGTTPSFF